ncbi:MAG: PD-(D/E)XK nuclease family protein [Mesorhizobium sp.]|nr:PD-(D/E)XK nuclease family protein [Mesorhizobium sp.]
MQGQLAVAAHRAAAARAGLNGLQIMTVTHLASRLAGGFLRRATREELEEAVGRALADGGFGEIEEARHFPGMIRAVTQTLGKVWETGLNLTELAKESARAADLTLVERRIRTRLPPMAMLPDDIVTSALARIDIAPAVLGDVTLDDVHFVEPVWRPLLDALRAVVSVGWNAPAGADTAWFGGAVNTIPEAATQASPVLVTCADPRHEVLEAFRWARRLMAQGKATAEQIAIAAASTGEWDDHVVALADETGLRVSFPHGRPCLATVDGQRCAALADVLLHGLSQSRLRRLVSLTRGQGTTIDQLPDDWSNLPRNIPLGSTAEWSRAYERHAQAMTGDPRPILMPLLTLLERGPEAAGDAARTFLRGRARHIWDRATSAAPAAALELTLRSIRVEDEQDPAGAIAWVPAWQLAAAPRSFVRLLGLTGRSWPRATLEDPLLPDHMVSAKLLDLDPPNEADRRAFAIITGYASSGLVLSRSRRDAQGALTGPSPLLDPSQPVTTLARVSSVRHAASEADRLSARPSETASHPLSGTAVRCWQNWHRAEPTDHDGLIAPNHAVIVRSITVPQSPTSLTRLLRDPLGFVWRYGLGWRRLEDRDRPLMLQADEFGTLVHELLRRTVEVLEPLPGFTVASHDEIATALAAAVQHITTTWPLERAVPPHVLWVNTVRQASEMALAGLTWESFTETGTRSWTEVPFGDDKAVVDADREWPWNPTLPVPIPGTAVTIRGKIDRVDVRSGAIAVRVTDYKTGTRPDDVAARIIAGGSELQRVLYGLACRTLLPDTPAIRARLIYLKGDVLVSPLSDLDGAIEQVGRFVTVATEHLVSTRVVPGPGAEDRFNDLNLALPASPSYFRRKQVGFNAAAGQLPQYWELP